jgi:hypothetical protein
MRFYQNRTLEIQTHTLHLYYNSLTPFHQSFLYKMQ